MLESYHPPVREQPRRNVTQPPPLTSSPGPNSGPFSLFYSLEPLGLIKGHKYRHPSSPLSTLPNSNDMRFETSFLPSPSKRSLAYR
jgi:hypothetical protein